MHRYTTVIGATFALLAGYVLAALPGNGTLKIDPSNQIGSGATIQVLAQAEPAGLEAQERTLLNQIQADTAKLRADEAAENAQKRRVNPQIKFIRAALLTLSEAAGQLEHTTKHYQGHRAEALKRMAEAHNQLMQCYRIDSQG